MPQNDLFIIEIAPLVHIAKREYDQVIPQSHREEEPQNIYSNNTSVRQ